MAQSMRCDMCEANPAVMLLSFMEDGTTFACCAGCLPQWAAGLVAATEDAPPTEGAPAEGDGVYAEGSEGGETAPAEVDRLAVEPDPEPAEPATPAAVSTAPEPTGVA